MIMKILIGCEFSGIVRDAFIRKGYDATSCDLLPTEKPGPHYQGDIFNIIDYRWDMAIFFPPCTYLSKAGARWWKQEGREEKSLKAFEFVMRLYNSKIPKIAIENPRGKLNKYWRYPDQVIQPYWFGDPFSKATCLWLKNLPPLMATNVCSEFVPFMPSNTGGAKRGQKHTQGIAKNQKQASTTFPGIAEAMANQWGKLL
jgi:hypothetical protein